MGKPMKYHRVTNTSNCENGKKILEEKTRPKGRTADNLVRKPTNLTSYPNLSRGEKKKLAKDATTVFAEESGKRKMGKGR